MGGDEKKDIDEFNALSREERADIISGVSGDERLTEDECAKLNPVVNGCVAEVYYRRALATIAELREGNERLQRLVDNPTEAAKAVRDGALKLYAVQEADIRAQLAAREKVMKTSLACLEEYLDKTLNGIAHTNLAYTIEILRLALSDQPEENQS